jgi:hypothetical protein
VLFRLVAACVAATIPLALPSELRGESINPNDWPNNYPYPGGEEREWPDGPNKSYLKNLQRPDNWKHPERWLNPKSLSCCDVGDTVKTKFKVEQGDAPHPEDRWYAWINGQWVLVPPDKIVPDYAPDGTPYLFMIGQYHSMLRAAAGRPVSARRVRAIAAAIVISSGAAADDRPKREWPSGPISNYLRNLQRPDNHKYPDRLATAGSCCDAADTVQTKFRVELADNAGGYPEDRWYAWLNERWVAIPPDVIVPSFAPDERGYLFVVEVPTDPDDGYFEGPGAIQVITCFVRPRGGL